MFSTLIHTLIPLYLSSMGGFFVAKLLRVDRVGIASILFYVFFPAIVLIGIMRIQIDAHILAIPLLTFCMSTILCAVFYSISRLIWKDATPNLIGLSAGTGNTGYFGLPVAMVLFSPETVAIYIAAILGTTLFESSIGFYLTARGTHTVRECVMRILRLPVLYAFFFGCLASIAHVPVPLWLETWVGQLRGGYSVLGMMIVGMGVAHVSRHAWDIKLIGVTWLAKFVAWPLLALLVTTCDRLWLHLYTPSTHQAILLLSLVPMPANTVVIATLLGIAPERIALSVLLSTIVALVYVPLMIGWLLG